MGREKSRIYAPVKEGGRKKKKEKTRLQQRKKRKKGELIVFVEKERDVKEEGD